MSRTDAPNEMLEAIYADIAARCDDILSRVGDWPCRAGCDRCCRTLGGLPFATEAEWRRVFLGVSRLSADDRARVREGLAGLVRLAEGPLPDDITCPLLDKESGRCRVYADRPAFCRTFGFFVERGEGRWCAAVEAVVGSERVQGVVWGNLAVRQAELARAFGPPVLLTEFPAKPYLDPEKEPSR